MSTILVTGGAGYIGAHICYTLAKAGHRVVVFDDLSTGHASFVKWGALEFGDVRDAWRLGLAFSVYQPDAVIHCAGRSEVAASVADPASYYDVNVAGTLTLLKAMREFEIECFVLSSTCAIYGAPQQVAIDEAHPQSPLSPYGRSKQMAEHMAADFADAYGIRFAHLRYFNAAGAAADQGIGESHDPETHAIPLALRATNANPFMIRGDSYATQDGTCERDYVHVLDLADAHVKAVEHLLNGGENLVLNLGSGVSVSVLNLVQAIGAPYVFGPPRAGDVSRLMADISLARRVLDWRPTHSLSDIIASASAWDVTQKAGIILRAS